jgi:ribosomal protein L29
MEAKELRTKSAAELSDELLKMRKEQGALSV